MPRSRSNHHLKGDAMSQQTALQKYYKTASSYFANPAKIKKLLAAVGAYIVKNKGSLKQIIKDVKLLLEMIKSWYTGKYTAFPKKTVVLMIAALIYFVSPFDLIPDFLLGGFIDDAAVIIWVFSSIADDVKKYKAWKSRKKRK